MATPIIEKPRLSPIHFRPVILPDLSTAQPGGFSSGFSPGFGLPAQNPSRYHIRHYLDDWFSNTIREWEEKVGYCQKVQRNDKMRLQFHVTNNDSVALLLIDCKGNTVNGWEPALTVAIAGNTEPYTNQPLTTYQFNFRIEDISTPIDDGVYYLLLQVMTGEVATQEISEPIFIADDFPGTIVLDYTNNTNDYNCIFEQTGVVFSLRVEGDMPPVKLIPTSTDTSYTNQEGTVSKLYGQPGRTFSLIIGGQSATQQYPGIPPYLYDKINGALLCDSWSIDGVEYVKDEGAKWAVEEVEQYPMVASSIVIREADPDRATFTLGPAVLTIVTLPATYPYALGDIFIGKASANTAVAQMRVIHNSGDRTALLAELNTNAPTYGLDGTFAYVGNDLVYNNAESEYYRAAAVTVYTTYFTYTVAPATANYSTDLNYQGAGIVDWGDTNLDEIDAATLLDYNHVYATAGTYTVTVFYLTGFVIDIEEPYMTAIAGTLPAQLNSLQLYGNLTTAFDCLMLNNCANTLTTLVIANTHLNSFTDFNIVPFTVLNYIQLGLNYLSSAAVSTFIVNLKDRVIANGITYGTLGINGQQPTPATLTLAGNSAKAQLQTTYNWTVTT